MLDLVLPARCPVCKQPVTCADRLGICTACQEGLPLLISPVCTTCGIPLDGAGPDHPCGRCISHPPSYVAARAAMRYEGSCKDLIHRFKYNHKSHLRRPLGLIMADHLAGFAADCKPDLLLPVPLHLSRLRSRGFNQSVLLAELLADHWQLPLLRDGLIRTRPTPPQVELTQEQRRCNLKDAFQVRQADQIKKRHIMLVDDVFTTGSTLQACADALLDSGCLSVSAVTIAHAP